MILSKKQTIEDLIIENLAKNPYMQGIDLVKQIQNIRPKTVKQAVYAALTPLVKNEVVSKIGAKYFLSRVWLNKVTTLLQNKKQIIKDAVFELEEKESISYHFPSLLTCDTYWAHIFDLFIEWIPANRPIVIWNPHEWFAIGRTDEESDIFKQFKIKNKFAIYSIQGKTPLDKEFRKNWTTDHVSISTGGSITYQSNYYLNIFDNIILEVFIDKKLALKIEEFYQKYEKLTPENVNEFVNLISEKYKVRMKISRNIKKASKLRKKISKDFYIAKHLII